MKIKNDSSSDIEKISAKNIRIGSIIGYLAFFLNIAYGLFFVPWISSSLGDDYGIYSICFSLISLFLIDFGLGTTTNVFISKYRAENQNDKISSFISKTFRIFLILDLFLIVVFAIVYFLIPCIYSNPEIWSESKISLLQTSFLVTGIYSVFSFPFTIFSGVISAYERYSFQKMIDFVGKIIHIVFTVIVIVVLNKFSLSRFNLFALIGAYILSGALMCISRYYFVVKKLSIKIRLFSKDDFISTKSIISYSVYTAIIAICSRLIFTICPIIIGATSGSHASATFSFISTIEGYIYSFGSVMNGFYIAKLSRVKNEQNSVIQIENLGIKYGKIQLFFIGLIICGFACCGLEFCSIWLRNNPSYDYKEIYFGILLICTYQLIFIPESVFYSATLTNKNGAKLLSIIYMCRAIVNVTLASILSKFYGALGACYSIFIVRFVSLIAENIIYKKELKIHLIGFFKSVYLRFAPAFLLSLLVGLTCHFVFAHFSLPLFLRFVLIGISTSLVFISLSLLAFPKETLKSFFFILKQKVGLNRNEK